MKRLSKVALYIFVSINAILVGMLLLSAYSPYINPEAHPVRACLGMVFPFFLLANLLFILFWLIFSYKLMALPLLGLLLCAPQIRSYVPLNMRTKQKDIPANSIKLLSYNVMGFSTFKKYKGENPIVNYIKNSGADIVCLQEYGVAQNRKYLTQDNMDRALKAYPYKSIERVGGKGSSNYVACYSKYPILSARTLEYESRMNGSVLYEIQVGNDVLTVINNHLESNKISPEDKVVYEGMIKAPEVEKVKSGAAQLIAKIGEAQALRAPQARAVAAAVAQTPNPYVIVCGDFNDSPISYANRVIEKQLNNAFVSSGNGLGISYNRNMFYFRIDNIMTSKNLKTYNCTVDRSIRDSDHYPIWCYVAKK